MPLKRKTDRKSSKDSQAQGVLQQVLLKAFGEARLRNPAYSLRSFARRLQCSPAALSEILNNKRRVSTKLAQRFVDCLDLDPQRAHEVLTLFGCRTAKAREVGANPPAYSELAVDQFRAVADWYHFAILSLAETRGFLDDARWIARRLDVRLQDVESALDRLERLGMLKRNSHGQLEPSGNQFVTTDEIASTAIRGAHSQILDLARFSLERDQMADRDFTTMTMAIDPQRLGQAKKMIRQFRAKLCEFLEQGERTEVYQLGINLFPLSRPLDEAPDDDQRRKT